MFFHTFPVGAFECNCVVIADEQTREAIVVDPGDEPERILDVLRAEGLDTRAIVHTHAHLDHVQGTRRVHEVTHAPIVLHPDDVPLYDALPMQGAMFGFRVDAPAPLSAHLAHDEVLRAGSIALRVIHTPGHTPGSVCFACSDGPRGAPVLLSGDTLFHRSVGRTDLWGGDAHKLADSIRTRIYTLEHDTEVLPGHGPWTAIGAEARHNPFVTASR